jgi:DedD protein
MNDHNLDDLIIDTPTQKGGKAKGFLTIIALFIVVLIVAIVLTKIILKDPDADRAVLVENDTEMVSPELTLQSANEEKGEEENTLSEMIESEVKETEEVDAPKAVEKVTEETVTIQEEKVPQTTKEQTVTPEPKPVTETKKTTPVSKPKEIVKIPTPATVEKPVQKPVIKSKPKPQPVPVKPAHERFYIQVGSFSKTPSSDSRLISTVKKQGYRYIITKVNGMHKVLIGPYKSRAEVDRAIIRVKDLINKSAFVVKK